ncbi:trimeric intracellular cation channel family protein [Xanthobacter sp. DSM 14520]|uniref:trimeric intracellular cation channel family protein n=1 Tax=Xanthobacter autotrophicus (strain ATCC BAA-1158 / Py2) TaxID=78245 RepID=UPI003726C067
METADLLKVLYIVAIVAEAMTAALAAGRREMDWVGVCLLGSVTALGGGSVRDVLLGRHPLSWVQHPEYLLITCGAALATIMVARYMRHLRHVFLFLDAVGLVVFTVIGCNVAMSLDMPVVVVIAAGMITGCVGGVLRDVLCADVPLLFRAELYGTVSIVTGGLYVAGKALDLPHDPLTIGVMALGLGMRMLALRFGWRMPKFVYTETIH